MVKSVDLLALFQKALADKFGYIYGTYGQEWTRAKQAAATRETTVKYGAQWIGHRVADCSGLGYWAFRELGGSIYHGSNTIWNKYVTGRCDLKGGVRTDGSALLPGDPVFLRRKQDGAWNRHHIGYYVGGDTVIEAKSTYYGVVTSKLSHWDETAHWLNVEYEGGVIFVGKPTLRKGDSGPDVEYLQGLLNTVGYGLAIDGKFGWKTETAVKGFQYDHQLKDDGIVGDMTWAALEKAAKEKPEVTEDADDDYGTLTSAWEQIEANHVMLTKAEWAILKAAYVTMGDVIKKHE